MAIQPKTRIPVTDYYRLPEYEQHELIQLIDGEVIVSVPPIPKHQAIVGEILFILMTIAKKRGGKAYTSPIEVYLDEHNVFEPDILYLVPNTTCKIEDKRLVGAPDLVVEVLSPSTAKFDRHQKYLAYEKHGVKEYWIVDPVHEVVEVWTLDKTVFNRQGAYAEGDSFTSVTLSEIISVDTIISG